MRISNRKRILVTGGAGFLGSHLCDRLLAEGNDVLCVDNFYSGAKDNVAHLMGNPHFELMRHDVTFPLYVEVDEIYNLACPASPVHYQWDPVQTTKTSVHGAINMLGLAKRTKARIFQASTSEVYGDPKTHPQREDYWGNVNPIGPRSCYDEGKRCAETLFFDYHRQHKLRIKVARIFNTYPARHPACPAAPIHYQYDPVQTTKTSVHGAINMLGLAKRVRAKILQASTSEVYGDPKVHPQTEDYWGHVNPIGIRSCYDEGKRCAETLFFDYYRQHKLRIKVARIFNTYGPRMHPNDGRVVSNFILQALKGEPITVYGEGSQTRSFCYVDDQIEALVRLMNSPDDFTGPVNVGNPTEFTILQLAQKVIELTGSKSEVIFKPLPSDDPTQRQPDISLARARLGWQPGIQLADGLSKTVEYFRTLRRQTS